MLNQELLTEEQKNKIKMHCDHLMRCDTIVAKAMHHFLTKDADNDEIVVSRKLFILKILKEHTHNCQLYTGDIPKEIADKLINAYSKELEKEEEAKREHINSLLKEMENLF